MKVSLKWLSEYVHLTLPPEDLARRLTLSTAEVEAIQRLGGTWDHVTIGSVVGVAPHPNADRLRLATVDAGSGPRTVVCGAPNVAAGQKIAFAEVGAHLIDGHTGKPSVLKANKIRGVESPGMVCSERELGLSDEHEGILVLPDDAPAGMPLRDYLGDTVLDLYSWPHRPDLMSMIGISREVAALTGQALHEPGLDYEALSGPLGDRITITIEAPELCSRYVAGLVEDIQLGPSPAWMQERLQAAGMRPINNVVDVTNYVMLEFGQPLHAFDYDRVQGGHVVVRRARKDEQIVTLDNVKRTLDPSVLVIADPSVPIGLAGVMGGATSEVSGQTTRVLLESANFNGLNIRHTSESLRLRSEASARFEKSIGPAVAMVAARRAVQLMVETCRGRAAAGFVDVYPGRRPSPVVAVTDKRIRTVLGADIEPDQVFRSLGALGFIVDLESEEAFRVTVPGWRTDVHLADDVIEEIIRVAGYETIPRTTISGRIPEPEPQPLRELRLRLQDLLVQAGMQEIITYSLVSEEMLAKVHGSGRDMPPPLRIVNPASSEHVYLRTTLRASLLTTLASNMRHRRLRTDLFEAARVYIPSVGELPIEEETAVGVLAGRRPDRWGMPGSEAVDFFDAKGIVEAVLEQLGVKARYQAAEDGDLLPGRTASIVVDDAVAGVVGQVHPDVAARFDLSETPYLFEINLNALLPALGRQRRFETISRYPAIRKDRALIVDDGVTSAQIEAIVARGRYVVEVRPFDVYTGTGVGAGQRSLTYAVFYQAQDHTLTDDEVAQSEARILQQLERQLGVRARDAG